MNSNYKNDQDREDKELNHFIKKTDMELDMDEFFDEDKGLYDKFQAGKRLLNYLFHGDD